MRKLLLATLLGSACLSQAPTDPPKLGNLSGVVANLAGQPLKGAILRLEAAAQNASGPNQTNRQPLAYSSSSDAQGNFYFENLDPGRYTLSAERTGYLPLKYSDNAKITSSLLDFSSGQQVTGLALKMTPQALVAGRILNEDNEPFPTIVLYLEQWTYSSGHKQLQNVGRVVVSDADGAYAIGGLDAGTYYVFAAAPPAQTGPFRAELRRGREAPDENYVGTYFPSATDPAGASPVKLTAGSVVRGLDIRMRKAAVYQVRGRVIDPSSPASPPNANVTLTRRDGSSPFPGAGNFPGSYRNGAFQFSGVLPGVYTLRATAIPAGGRGGRNGAAASIGAEIVSVGNADVESVEVRLGHGVEISGKLVTEGPPPATTQNAQAAPNLRTRITLDEQGNGGNGNTTINDDGTFLFQGVLPGTYRVMVNPVPAGTYVKSIRFGNQELTKTLLDLNSGAGGNLQIVLSSNSADISGVVHDTSSNGTGQPLNGVTVSLWTPGIPPENAIDFSKIVTTDANGQFKFSGLAPGDYRVAAWEQVDRFLVLVPEFRSKFESQAITIKLNENDHAQTEPPLIPRDSIEAEASKLR